MVQFSDPQIEDAAKDPARCVAMVWRIAMDARTMAAQRRAMAKLRPSARGKLIEHAEALEQFSIRLLDAVEHWKNEQQ